ncbi:hypothetical protein T4B_4954 [Trichinella pseudospiralis]|uniref:Uncharacterized protein n=1 Tax=Trichinella pseudospiralis TaxID=6337 RepID=A0A0V1E9N7_TRIPS|nr:hypothetical protein T4A_10875 [Trichinella pseudospiralis]KRZ26127.1 hypothetical protein T4C_13940 [Trichinella pseudospiralis]KRZ29828.1 hypothetical protein T4B_4954 [Trichinella pseudospiralis]
MKRNVFSKLNKLFYASSVHSDLESIYTVVVILKGTVLKSTMPTITIKRRLFKDYFGDIIFN